MGDAIKNAPVGFVKDEMPPGVKHHYRKLCDPETRDVVFETTVSVPEGHIRIKHVESGKVWEASWRGLLRQACIEGLPGDAQGVVFELPKP